jgi:flagellar basal-body rod protein FlgG
VTEITSLIVAQRAYEMNSKVITTSDQMLAAASQLKG